MAVHQTKPSSPVTILTQEQDEVLDLYLKRLDEYLENQKDAEKVEVEIETLHLKRILSAHD